MIVKKRFSALLMGGIILLGLGLLAVATPAGRPLPTVVPGPDPNNVPFYPDAQQITSREAKNRYENGQFVISARVTTYVTHASPAEVEAYYHDKMSSYGWGDGAGGNSSPLYFRFGGTREGPPTDQVTIYVTALPDKRTQVQIFVMGYDLRPQP